MVYVWRCVLLRVRQNATLYTISCVSARICSSCAWSRPRCKQYSVVARARAPARHNKLYRIPRCHRCRRRILADYHRPVANDAVLPRRLRVPDTGYIPVNCVATCVYTGDTCTRVYTHVYGPRFIGTSTYMCVYTTADIRRERGRYNNIKYGHAVKYIHTYITLYNMYLVYTHGAATVSRLYRG